MGGKLIVNASRQSLDGLADAVLIPEERIWLANFTSPRSRSNYHAAIADFCRTIDIEGSAALYGVTPAHVIAYRDLLTERQASPRTVGARLAALSSLFKHLAEKQLVAVNPVSGIKRPKIGRRQVKARLLSSRQVRRMLDLPDRQTQDGRRDRALLHLYFYTGCRLAEAINIRVCDFEPSKFDEPLLRMKVKGGREHELYIADTLAEAIEEYLSAANHGHLPKVKLIQSVKRRADQDGITDRQAGRIFSHYAQKVGLSDQVTPHAARATFITMALESGAPIENVQDTVGHSDISTTRLYDKRRFKPENSASRVVSY